MIFSTVSTFVEQVGRRQFWRYAELDQMTTVFNGPSSLVMQYKPQVDSPHPEFPLMFCIDSEVTKQAALIAEISATYAGIMDSSTVTKLTLVGGGSSYVTKPVLSINPVQGSRDFQRVFQTSYATASKGKDSSDNTITILTTLYNCGTQTTTVHYLGTQVTIKYQAYPITGIIPVPMIVYNNLGMPRVTWQVLSEALGMISLVLQGADAGSAAEWMAQQASYQIPPLFAAYLGGTQQQRGLWYDITEVYGPTF